jgi:4,5-DOPA dioxygenase extradiol
MVHTGTQNIADQQDQLMPTVFAGHGSPMNAIESNDYTQALNELGQRLPRPKAVLSVSAHWVTDGTLILTSEHPETIHDFYGFPEELYKVRYPAPGAPEIAELVAKKLKAFNPSFSSDWGLDHGTWAVVRHIFPNADVPVLQMSLNRNLSFREHLDIGRALTPLRRQGILIIGSGNIVHNLRRIDWSPRAKVMDWAREFDEMIKAALVNRDEATLLGEDPRVGPLWTMAHPTTEHYLPLLYAYGASTPEDKINFIYEGIQMGSMAMRTLVLES